MPGTMGRGVGQPGNVGNVGRGPGNVGNVGRGPGNVGNVGRGPGNVGNVGRGPGNVGNVGRGPGNTGRSPGNMGRGPSNARGRWNQNWNQHHGNWNHNGNWGHNNNWGWNNSNFFFGFFFYPGFGFPFDYGYWGFDSCGAYCTYSPFYYYGYPYVYAPRVVVQDVPDYTYSAVPDYTSSNYYLSQGAYSGLNVALDDIRNAFINSQPDLLLKHVDASTQIQIYLDNNYAYSLPGSDYQNMVKDAVTHIKTISFTLDGVQQRSDGAYTVTGTHVFTDVKGVQKSVNVSYTLAQSGGNWVIVAVGSSGG